MADNKDPVINEFMEGMKSYTGSTGTSPTFVDDSATTGFKEEVSPFIDEDSDDVSSGGLDNVEPNTPTPESVDPNSEVVEVTIDGKVSRVKVDMSNKEQLRKAVVASVQAKHFMAQQKVQHAALAKQVEDLKDAHTSFGEVEKAFRSKGIEGLVDLMSNKEGAYKDFLQKQVQKEMLRRDASPAELERYELFRTED